MSQPPPPMGSPAFRPTAPMTAARPRNGGVYVAVSIVAFVLPLIQFLAGLLGLAYDVGRAEPTALQVALSKVFIVLWATTLISFMLAGSLVVLSLQYRKSGETRTKKLWWWLLAIVVALCVATWVTGIESIPPEA